MAYYTYSLLIDKDVPYHKWIYVVGQKFKLIDMCSNAYVINCQYAFIKKIYELAFVPRCAYRGKRADFNTGPYFENLFLCAYYKGPKYSLSAKCSLPRSSNG